MIEIFPLGVFSQSDDLPEIIKSWQTYAPNLERIQFHRKIFSYYICEGIVSVTFKEISGVETAN